MRTVKAATAPSLVLKSISIFICGGVVAGALFEVGEVHTPNSHEQGRAATARRAG